MTKKIVIIGPESTGKTTLTTLLAKHYNAPKVDEQARAYLADLGGDYTFDDVIKMAKEQLAQEELAGKNNKGLLFLDTDLLVFKVWIKEKYDKEVEWIEGDHLKKATDKIYLLCDVDIPWEFDEQREHPSKKDRERLFKEYEKQLKAYGLTYYIVSGNIEQRLERCDEILNLL